MYPVDSSSFTPVTCTILKVRAISAVLFLFAPLSPLPAHANPTTGSPLRFRPPTLTSEQLAQVKDRGGPGGTRGAGTRGDCPALNGKPAAIALVPQMAIAPAKTVTFSLTTEAHPTLWFYVPYDRAVLSRVRVALVDEADEPVMEPITVPLQQVPGIVGVRLPDRVPPLAVGKVYRWYGLIDCQPQGTTDIFVDALIQRIASPLPATNISPKERIRFYAEQGIWQDLLTDLHPLRQQSPNPYAEEWRNLLESQGLTSVAKE